jgi:superfamily II DNA/RNA helicase
MDFQRFGIDVRLAEAAESLKIDFYNYEKLLTHTVENQENVCAKIVMDEGREEVLLLPVLQWLLSGESRKALVLVQDGSVGDSCAGAIGRLGSGAGISLCRAERDAGGTVRLDGDRTSAILLGELDALLALPDVNLRDFGYIVVDGADRVAELPSETIHKFVGMLLPSWERRSLLACAKISVKAKNLAWDLAENPVEIGIDGEVAKAQSVVKETWSLPGEAKLKFLLGLLAREKPERVCVFCNLRDTAKELSLRLEANGVGSDYILGALAMDRKRAVLAKAKSGERPCLVLTDQGAEGLGGGSFPLVVNYDIPLEPELFVKRIEMLDRSLPGAKVVSLACERYIYGLSAVESHIDAKLNALPVDEALLAVEDKSEGMGTDARERRGGEGRREGADGRNRGEGRSGNRDRQRGGAARRDSRRDSRTRYDAPREDRSPDIRRSISEATGGSLDMKGEALPRGAPPVSGRLPSKGMKGRGAGDARREAGDHRGRQRGNEGQRKPEGQRGDRGNKVPGRSAAPKQVSRRSTPDDGKGRNPYDVPIEERMKRYREKYGQDLDAKGHEGKRRGSQPKAAPKGAVVPRAPRDAAPPESPQGRRDSPSEDKPQGFFGQLFGSFRKKGN